MRTRRSDSRSQGGRAAAFTACGLATAFVAVGAEAEDAAIAPPAPVRAVVIGQEYQAGGGHRWPGGDAYRAPGTGPTRADPLRLHAVAGGLAPVQRAGGR